MTIEHAHYRWAIWQSKELPPCRHPEAEKVCYDSGEPTGLYVGSMRGDYLWKDLENFMETGDIH